MGILFKKAKKPECTVASIGPRAGSSGSKARIIVVGGGKGGIGKSVVTCNLGIVLSKSGYRVLLVDADLGAANLHTFIGLNAAGRSLSSFLKSEVTHLDKVTHKTGIKGLDIVTGANDSLDVADIKTAELARLKCALDGADYDYVVMDIGPGTAANTLDLFLMADEGVMMTTPEPTSIENAYRFLKCLFLRTIRNIVMSNEDSYLKDPLVRLFTGESSKRIRTVSDILHVLRRVEPERGEMLQSLMSRTAVSLLLNMTSTEEERGLGEKIQRASTDYFGVKIRYLGDIRRDAAVAESISRRRPLALHYHGTPALRDIESCAQRLTGKSSRLEVPQVIS